MDTFAPEFSRFWVQGPGTVSAVARDDRRDDEAKLRAQQEALERLAERVSAARTVI